MKDSTKLAWISGLTGFGLIAVGAIAYARGAGAAGVSGLGKGRHIRGRAAQAPVINTVTRDGMTTVLREHNKMPIEMRVASIQAQIEKGVQDPRMRKLALQITRHCPERDGLCEAKAVYDYVKANVRYAGDVAPIRWQDGKVEGIDVFQSPQRTLEFGAGDCDDHTKAVAVLLAHNGITPRLRVVKTKGAPDWEHIYGGALLPKGTGNKFVSLDTTLPGNNNFGVEPTYHKSLDFDA